MDWNTMDDEALGHAVDAWLASLRAQGLSVRRLRDLAGLLGQAMRPNADHTREEMRVLARFATWWGGRADTANTPKSERRP